jgi:hypothetical protein
MKHIIPFAVPDGTVEALVLVRTITGELVVIIPVAALGHDTVSVEFRNMPEGTYSCHLLVGDAEVYRRVLVVL